MSQYAKGSEWRKWDLHVHTPESHGFTGNWEQFKTQLKNADCDVVGINDYFSVAGYKKIKAEVDKGSFDIGDKVLFPVVEMRMKDQLQNKHSGEGSSRHFNFHIIFNNQLELSEIENFIKALKYEDTTISNDYSDAEKLKEKKVSFDEVLEKLKGDSKFRGQFLVWLPYDEYGGIDEIDPNSDSVIKSNFIKRSDILGSSNKKQRDFFLWRAKKEDGTEKYSLKQFESWLGSKKPCIKGSDSHAHSDVVGKLKNRDSQPTEKFCWLKADPTFEGLKQIIYEPEERIFIGKKPPILEKVKDNPTKYLKSLEVNKSEQWTSGDTWFEDVSIPFNKELVAIIGNKGSGKSALADILGLVGRADIDKKYFSFLHKDKFLKGGLAGKFSAKAIWESDNDSEKLQLNEEKKGQVPEAVRFIPQSYFEDLTNEIEILNFKKILEKIIYRYVPNEKKLEIPSFDELVTEKTKNIKSKINDQKNKIQEVNGDIIKLEKKNNSKYRTETEELIKQKNLEIEAQEKLLAECPKIANPEEGAETKEIVQNISEYNRRLNKLKKKLEEKQALQIRINKKITFLEDLERSIREQEEQVKSFVENNENKYKELDLKINDIFKIETDYTSMTALLEKYREELKNNNVYLVRAEDVVKENTSEEGIKSVLYQIDKLDKNIEEAQSKLTNKGREFQENEQRKTKIKEAINILKGDDAGLKLETLNYYKKEELYLDNDLSEELAIKRKERVEASLEIFKAKNEIIAVYNNLKVAVDQKIEKNHELLDGYDIKIDSSFNLDVGFYDYFLAYINQGRTGCFYGRAEGMEKIKTIIEESGFDTEDKIRALLGAIITKLEEGGAEISEQVNKGKLIEFYNYIFSLEYIETTYELKSEGKTLLQLSPGERGALLLVFYLMIDKEEIPLIIDQPEDNLDNESVYNILSKFIKRAKKRRQIIMVTHNPNLAVGSDAEQIIYVSIDKTKKNKFSFISGSIENPEINKKIVQILEGTKPAFDKRKLKYQMNSAD